MIPSGLRGKVRELVKAVLQTAIERLPASALGLRTHSLPTEDFLEECVDGARAAGKESKLHVVIGSHQHEGPVEERGERIWVGTPSDAAALATKLRSDRDLVQQPGFLLAYMSTVSSPGEGGLRLLVPIDGRAVVSAFVDANGADLPLLRAVAQSNNRRLMARLADCGAVTLSRYAESAGAAEQGEQETYSLPHLGLIPDRLDDAAKPAGRWAKTWDDLDGVKDANKLKAAGSKLRGLEAGDDATWRSVNRALIDQCLVPKTRLKGPDGEIKTDAAAKVAAELAASAASFALGLHSEEDESKLLGFNRQLLRLLRKGEGIIDALIADDTDGDGGDPPTPEEERLREEVVLELWGDQALGHPLESLSEETSDEVWKELHLNVPDDATPQPKILTSPGRSWLLSQLLALEDRRLWSRGGYVITENSEIVLTQAEPPRDESQLRCFSISDDNLASLPAAAKTVVSEFFKARRQFLDAASAYVDDAVEEADNSSGTASDTGEVPPQDTDQAPLGGVVLLDLYPLHMTLALGDAARNYVARYSEMSKVLVSEEVKQQLHGDMRRWLLNLDVVFSVRDDHRVLTARLLPLHPLRIAHSLLWTQLGVMPPDSPECLAINHMSQEAERLSPHGLRYCYHCLRELGPSQQGVALAVRAGLRAVWALLEREGLAEALAVDLVDVADPAPAIEALCEEFEKLAFASGGSGLLQVATKVSSGRTQPPLSRKILGPAAREAFERSPEDGTALRLSPNKGLVHLVVQAKPTPHGPTDVADHYAEGVHMEYVVSPGGQVSRLQVFGDDAGVAYRGVLKNVGGVLPANEMLEPTPEPPQVGDTLVCALVARRGWPFRAQPYPALLAYEQDGEHVVALLLDPEVSETVLPPLVDDVGIPAGAGLAELREGIVRLPNIRGFLVDVLRRIDPKKLRGDVGELVAFKQLQEEAGDRCLILSLDSPEGHLWAAKHRLLYGTRERADLLLLVADQGLERLLAMKVIELKTRSENAKLDQNSIQRSLSKQARLVAARVRDCFRSDGGSANAMSVEGLRHVVWLGASHQRLALKWRSVLQDLDRALQSGGAPPVQTECWVVLAEAWTGQPRFTSALPRLDPRGEVVVNEVEEVSFRVISPPTHPGGPTASPDPGTPAPHGDGRAPSDSAQGDDAPPGVAPTPVVSERCTRCSATLPTGHVGELCDRCAGSEQGSAGSGSQGAPPEPSSQPGPSPAEPSPQPAPPEPSRRGRMDLAERYECILATFAEFKVSVERPDDGEPVCREGPGFYVARVKPGHGVHPQALTKLIPNLKLKLGLPKELTPRGTIDSGTVVFEIPKTEDERYYVIAEDLWERAERYNDRLYAPLGEDIDGDIVGIAFSPQHVPHLLIGGTTGSGKSVALETLLMGLCKRYSATELELVLIDPKGTELIHFEDAPHLVGEIGYDAEDAKRHLDEAVHEMERRYKLLREKKVRSLPYYNQKVPQGERLPWRLIVLDEYADLSHDPDDRRVIEQHLSRLAQKARASGIHVIVATQKPSAKVLSTTIRSNLPAQLALKTKTAADSRIIMDEAGAEALAGAGDAFLKTVNSTVRIQCAKVANPEAMFSTEPGEAVVLFEKYTVLKILEAGGMSDAFKVSGPDSGAPPLFLKRVANGGAQSQALQREQKIYFRLCNHGLENVLEVLCWESDDRYSALVTEFAGHGSLYDHVPKERGQAGLPFPEVKDIAIQITNGLRGLHQLEIVHRDLKPDNVVSTAPGVWKLADFGIAKDHSRVVIGEPTFKGYHTIGYAPPEQLDPNMEAAPSFDVYSFGKLLVFMLTGQTDVDRVTAPMWVTLVRGCTKLKPQDRPPLDQVIAQLEGLPF